MKQAGYDEDLDPELIRMRIAEGKIVIPANRKRKATQRFAVLAPDSKPGQRQHRDFCRIIPMLKRDGKSYGSGRSRRRYGNGP